MVKLTTVLASVNNNREYYMFIPIQILLWRIFNIRFIAIFVGDELPDELKSKLTVDEIKNNIILWNKNKNLKDSFVSQNIRMYYPSLIKNLCKDEIVMITDMDMLPANPNYYCKDIECISSENFIYYRNIDNKYKQIYMCYNAAHPDVWCKVFGIENEKDIENKLNSTYKNSYTGIPGKDGWYIDQEIMYNSLINFPNLIVLDRHPKRLETDEFYKKINTNDEIEPFINKYDDIHIHRSYFKHEFLISIITKQLKSIYKK